MHGWFGWMVLESYLPFMKKICFQQPLCIGDMQTKLKTHSTHSKRNSKICHATRACTFKGFRFFWVGSVLVFSRFSAGMAAVRHPHPSHTCLLHLLLTQNGALFHSMWRVVCDFVALYVCSTIHFHCMFAHPPPPFQAPSIPHLHTCKVHKRITFLQ